MSYIKQISIKSNPKKTLEYILNVNKTNGELISGINIIPDVDFANNHFSMVFNQYHNHGYNDIDWNYTDTRDKTHKYAVKLHHFIQSFEEGTITPEVAHKLGEEWVKECFGEKSVVVVATHIDKGHIHNHFAVSPYTLNGEKINSNKKLINKCREISNNLCRKYDIKNVIVEKTAENKRLGKKNTYIEDNYIRPQGRSWKQQIEQSIDELLPRVNAFEELLQQLEKKNYIVDTHGKYVKVKPQGKDRFVRLKSLSFGYDEQSLRNKILESLRSKVIVNMNVEVTAAINKKPLRQLLKEDIDNVISQSVSFEDFLKRMQVDYTIKRGTHIAFRKDGYGQSFIRSRVLGVDYDEEHIKERIKQVNINRKSEVVQGISNAIDDNIVSLAGLEQKQKELATKMGNLNKKITDLSNQISQYDELKSIEVDYIKFADMPMSKMTILDTINKQKAELILFKHDIHNKQEFIERLKKLEDIKHTYDLLLKECDSITKEYRYYTKLVRDYHKVHSQESMDKNNLKTKKLF